jgi:hypothetical protein
MPRQTRTTKTQVEGPYVPKTDGGVFFRYPHGDDQLVTLCEAGVSPGLIASMLNFALARGFTEQGTQNGRSDGYSRLGRRPAVKKRKRTVRTRMTPEQVTALARPAGVDCDWCGDDMIITKPGAGPYCRPCGRSYAQGYAIELKRVAGTKSEAKARIECDSKQHATAKRWRKQAARAGQVARESNILSRGCTPLRPLA